MTKKQKIFNSRGFVSVLMGIAFVAITISGVILFIAPPGRVTNWTDWRIWGLTKHQWATLHVWFSLVFLATGLWHLYLHWKPMRNYFKSKLTRKVALRPEWMLALAIAVLISVGSVMEWRPFSTLMDYKKILRDSWSAEDHEPGKGRGQQDSEQGTGRGGGQGWRRNQITQPTGEKPTPKIETGPSTPTLSTPQRGNVWRNGPGGGEGWRRGRE